ncbi:12668_t:CDS:2, partial [Dentiscutata heterogama]
RVRKGHEEMKSVISDYIRDFDKVINKIGIKEIVAGGNLQIEISTTFQEVRDLENMLDKVLNLAFYNDKAFQNEFNEETAKDNMRLENMKKKKVYFSIV